MRGWWLVLLCGCYAPKAQPGTPCTPSLANCPGDQVCARVDGNFICTNEPPGLDAATAPDTSGDAIGTDARWTVVRSAGAVGTVVDFPATAAGSTIIVAIETDDIDPVDMLSDNANTAYTRIAASRAVTEIEGLGVELWYARSANAGATRITALGDDVFAVVMWEVTGLDPLAPLGNVTRRQNQAPSTMPEGAALTTTSPGELVISVVIGGNAITGLAQNSPFTTDQLTNQDGYAHLTSNTAPAGTYTPRWLQAAAAGYCATSAAFHVPP